jgi:hypothetical protein
MLTRALQEGVLQEEVLRFSSFTDGQSSADVARLTSLGPRRRAYAKRAQLALPFLSAR